MPWKKGQSGKPAGRPKLPAEAQSMARKCTPMAIEALKRLASDPKAPPAAQVAASVALLDRAWGRPAQAMDVSLNRKTHEEMSDQELLVIAATGENEEQPTEQSTSH